MRRVGAKLIIIMARDRPPSGQTSDGQRVEYQGAEHQEGGLPRRFNAPVPCGLAYCALSEHQAPTATG